MGRVPFGGPCIKDSNILGSSILGSPYLGKLPFNDTRILCVDFQTMVTGGVNVMGK